MSWSFEKKSFAPGVSKKEKGAPGKEQRKTEITVPRASKRVIKISEVIRG